MRLKMQGGRAAIGTEHNTRPRNSSKKSPLAGPGPAVQSSRLWNLRTEAVSITAKNSPSLATCSGMSQR
jgi:hypothetical protein